MVCELFFRGRSPGLQASRRRSRPSPAAVPQTGSLTQLYGKSFGPPGGADGGANFGGHAVGRIATPQSARAPVKTWWDAPAAPAAPPQAQQEAGGLGIAKQPLYAHQVEMPAMAYLASVLEERMLLAVRLRHSPHSGRVTPALSLSLSLSLSRTARLTR